MHPPLLFFAGRDSGCVLVLAQDARPDLCGGLPIEMCSQPSTLLLKKREFEM